MNQTKKTEAKVITFNIGTILIIESMVSLFCDTVEFIMLEILSIINSLTFFIYGLLCLFTKHMVAEFTRYELLKFRLLTGFLEVFAALGVMIGLYFIPPLYIISVSGLAALMFFGVIVRVKVKDKLIQTAPAFLLFILNCYLLYLKIQGF